MYGLIYLITNKIDGKRYVGQTKESLNRRWRKHVTSKRGCRFLQNAIKKYGEDSFNIKVLSKCGNKEEMNHRESYYINLFSTLAPNGYNLKSGGHNVIYTDEAKKNMSDKMKQFYSDPKERERLSVMNTGKTFSLETRNKMSMARKLRVTTEETRKKLSKALTGSKNPFAGKKHPKELMDRIALASSKQIVCVENNKIYTSIRSAAQDLNVSTSYVSKRLSGKTKLSKHTFREV